MSEEISHSRGGARPFIKAQDIGLRALLGIPYENVSLSVPPNSFAIVHGEEASGKTPLLLTLAGRMAPTKGTLEVGGYISPKERNKIARIAGMGIFQGVNEIEENLSCKSILRAELELYGKPNRKESVLAYLEDWDLLDIQDTRVRDLNHMQLFTFGIALGMASDPKLLVVDDLDVELTHGQIQQIIDILRRIAHDEHKVVVAACTEPEIATCADVSFKLERRA